jgi:hypothetical protein
VGAWTQCPLSAGMSVTHGDLNAVGDDGVIVQMYKPRK